MCPIIVKVLPLSPCILVVDICFYPLPVEHLPSDKYDCLSNVGLHSAIHSVMALMMRLFQSLPDRTVQYSPRQLFCTDIHSISQI